ncbi:MAG TPA: hypothetical protein VHJ58_22590 [Vicinamibacterales bacterium]|nr:hypothetical protein [Vicinamibacterales bacterium]
MRRLALVPAILVIALVTALPAGASPVRTPRDFELSWETCPNLPTGTTLNGSGIESSITIERTDASGVTTILNATHTHGTTTDQDGNVYVFNYSNEFRVSNTVASPDVFTGLMTDHFSNSGSGPAKLNNGFVANVTFGPGEFDFAVDPISSFGDPLNFTDGTAACDPL